MIGALDDGWIFGYLFGLHWIGLWWFQCAWNACFHVGFWCVLSQALLLASDCLKGTDKMYVLAPGAETRM